MNFRSMKPLLIATLAGLSVFLYGIYGLRYPKNWNDIRRGSTIDQVKMACPNLLQGLHDMKGDFCEAGIPLIRWSLNVLYYQKDQVNQAHLVLFLGTKNYFKRIYVRDLALNP